MTARSRRPRRSGMKWVVLLLLFAGGYFLFGGFFQRLGKDPYPPNAFYHVKRADMLISIVEDGALRALNETVVRSGLEGLNRIIYLVPEGSYVQKGDLLVELDSSGLKDRFNEQELLYQERLFEMLQATGNLKIQKSLAESQIKDAELKLENAQSDLEKYRDGDAPLLIKTIEARSGVLAEQVRIATERYARTEELFKSGNATKSELEADALTLKREQLALSQYQEDLRLIKKFDQPNQIRLLQSKVEQAQAELARLKQRTSNEIAQAEADLDTSQAALQVMEEGLKTQQARLKNAKIFAPESGLVVYSSVSPFQFASDDDRRRDEGRFRGRGRGGDTGGGEFRGGGRRGGRSTMESNSGGSGGSGGSSISSPAETVAAGNQRIASAISGTPATEPNAAGGGGGAGSGGSGSSGGGRSGGASSGGGSSGGQNATSPAGAFASYASMRPSSMFGASTASNSAGNSANGGASSSLFSTGGQGSSFTGGSQFGSGNQFGFRSSSQNFRDFDSDYGTPGLLAEGTMVRQRQELIRLPDVSKMLAETKIAEARVRQVRAGMTAYVEVKNIPHRRFKGTVRRVALLPDSQSSWMNPNVKLFPADILVDEELPTLKPGVSASVEIIITNLTQVLSVPIQTVALLGGENVCFIKKGRRLVPVPVTTGWFNDSFIEITSGLKEGDLVLLAPVSDEDLEETPTEETNNVPQGDEFRDTTSSPRNGDLHEPLPPPRVDSFRNGQFHDPIQPTDSSRKGEPSDSRPRSELHESNLPGQGPPGEERRFRRRDSEDTNGVASPERRRGRQGRRPRNAEENPE